MEANRRPSLKKPAQREWTLLAWWLVGWILVGCTSTPEIRLESEGSDEIHLPARLRQGLFLVEVTFDGQGPFTMVVDSGSSLIHVDPSWTRLAGHRGRPRRIEVGPLSLRDLPIVSSDLAAVGEALGEPLHGILGWPAFARHLWTFDYGAGQLSVREGSLPDPNGQDVFGFVANSGPYLDIEIADQRRTLLLDTGSNSGLAVSSLDETYFESPPVVVGSMTTIEGVRPKRAGRLAHDVVFGSTRLERPTVSFTDQISTAGAGVLRDFVVTFDARHQRVRLQTPSRRAR